MDWGVRYVKQDLRAKNVVSDIKLKGLRFGYLVTMEVNHLKIQ